MTDKAERDLLTLVLARVDQLTALVNDQARYDDSEAVLAEAEAGLYALGELLFNDPRHGGYDILTTPIDP